MIKILTSNIAGLVGQPVKKGSLDHIFNSISEQSLAEYQAKNSNYDDTKVNVLFGCRDTGTGGAVNVSAGAVIYNGELFIVDAVSFTPADTPVAVITTTYVSATGSDPTEMTDGLLKNVHAIRKISIIDGSTSSANYVDDLTNFIYGDNRTLLTEVDYSSSVVVVSPSWSTLHTETMTQSGRVWFMFDNEVTPAASVGSPVSYAINFEITKNGTPVSAKILSVYSDGGRRSFTIQTVQDVSAGDTIVLRGNNVGLTATVTIDGRLVMQGNGMY